MKERFNIEIPWNKFNEEEIQIIIAIFFHSLDYNVQNLHKSDRANEGGADLVVKKGKEEIAIAVKIKPTQKDRYQLLELSRRKEQRKIYVYIQTPTKKFYTSMKNEGKKVEFWDIKKLNDFFIEKNMYFTANLIFNDHKIHKTFVLIRHVLFQLLENSRRLKKTKFKQMDKDSFFLLWRLKDVAVTIHQTSILAAHIFENPINFKNKILNGHFIKIFLEYLDVLERKINSFLRYFLYFLKKNKNLVYNSIIAQSDRSHWFWIASYNPPDNLNTLRKELKELTEDKETYKELMKKNNKNRRDKEFEDYYKELAKSNDVWKAIEYQIRNLILIGSGIEAIIDDIIKEYFNDYRSLNQIQDFTERFL